MVEETVQEVKKQQVKKIPKKWIKDLDFDRVGNAYLIERVTRGQITLNPENAYFAVEAFLTYLYRENYRVVKYSGREIDPCTVRKVLSCCFRDFFENYCYGRLEQIFLVASTSQKGPGPSTFHVVLAEDQKEAENSTIVCRTRVHFRHKSYKKLTWGQVVHALQTRSHYFWCRKCVSRLTRIWEAKKRWEAEEKLKRQEVYDGE